MTTKVYVLTMTDVTVERITVLLNSIPCFMITIWENIENGPMGEQFDLVLQCRNEDLRTVEQMFADLV